MSTITKEFTKEQLIERADHLLGVGKAFIAEHPEYDGMAKDVELFKIALASLEAEPYGYVHKSAYEEAGSCGLSNDHEAYRDSSTHIAVYTAPPAPVVPSELHPETQKLVTDFCTALADKLYKAQLKYGYDADWKQDGWPTQCQAHFHQHIAKGDPRDVAAYCAFMWYHGWKTEAAQPAPVSVPDYPETLPCPVMLEPGLRFGKGVTTKAMLGALQRRAEHYAELEAMTPEQRAKHDAGMKEFAAMIQGAEQPQNAPQNIPENIPATLFKPVSDLYGLTSPTGGETSFTFDAVEARDFIDGGWSCQEYVELERFQEAVNGNSPVIPDGWVMLPAEPTQAMMNAWLSEVANWRGHAAGYRAMIAAAPQQEV